MSSAFSFISSSSYFFGNYVPVNVSIRNLRLFLCEKYFNKNNNIISNLLFFMSLLILYKTFPYLLTFLISFICYHLSLLNKKTAPEGGS
ncbi:hypothetical protein J587_3764 [Acinetobacter baumannii 144107]|nr:hypothetical protein J587_3764 [Acinetobacter baumannii 144107]